MSRQLRVLIVEDSEDDAELLLRELRRGGFEPLHERVETAPAMRAALQARAWDVVISDFRMPLFDAPAALGVVKELGKDLPFIIVSGTVGEEDAVHAMKAGVHDYMSKGKLARLCTAIERELRDAAERAEIRRVEGQLRLADRMASLGTLAAGVAHEINNPLAAVIANLEFIGKQAAAAADAGAGLSAAGLVEEVAEPLRDAREGAERVRRIVRDLKIFSHASEEAREPVDLHHVLDLALRMASNEIRHRARLIKDFTMVPAVEANEGRLGQVFLNLLVNAAQAIPEGRADENSVRVITRTDERGWAAVEVHDTGSGIPPEILPRIFDPFFTTKAVGVGTGLGLSICHRIVTSLGGELRVESQIGRGSAFSVHLPGARLPARRDASPPAADGAGTAPRGAVLVVDDEPMILSALSRTLGPGHDVIGVLSAQEALGRVRAGERFDVVLCDLMMPEMTGMDLHAALEREAPDQAARMVFLTGGAFTPWAAAFLDEMPLPRLDKPFDARELRAFVDERVRAARSR